MLRLVLTGLLLASSMTLALAQNAPPTPAPDATAQQLQFFQKAIGVLQAQRNKAEDDAAQATAQAQNWKEQLDASRAEVQKLTGELAAAKPAAPVPAPGGEPKK